MTRDRYTPGHSGSAVAFMAGRSAASHAWFFLPELRPGMLLLDCGCGPGQITLGLARAVAPAPVHGIDLFDGQFREAQAVADAEGLDVRFQTASVYELPFEAGTFDAVFSHALLEHLADPVAALMEMRRVLRPGGVAGVCSPDWGGFIVTPPSDELTGALERYMTLQRANGGDPLAGRHLSEWLLEAGFVDVRLDARYERYEQPQRIAEYLASQLDDVDTDAARTLRDWTERPAAMFAQSWVSAISCRAHDAGDDPRSSVKRAQANEKGTTPPAAVQAEPDTRSVSAARNDIYTHGHHDSVLRSHRWRTAANSAPYLLPRLERGMSLLDVGCGPGTITLDFARLLDPGSVVGIDREQSPLVEARELGLATPNLAFSVGDVYALDFDDQSFDIVHAHQVLQHLTDPVGALREMARVCRPGGLVAVRDADYAAMTWYPADPVLDRWLALYESVARANEAEPDAGRYLVAWAHAAGLSDIAASASAWCYATPEDRAWWGELWAERSTKSSFAEQALDYKLATADELDEIAEAFRRWAHQEDGWFTALSGEILCKPTETCSANEMC